MKTTWQLMFLTLFFLACDNEDIVTPNPQETTPVVQAAATYDILLEEDIVYAEGLSHESLNSTTASTMPLKLDIYYPNNDSDNRPVYMFIHGGGFIGGDKRGGNVQILADYYAARGWVFISINYRLRDDRGTVPQEWIDYSTILEGEDVDQFMAIYPAQRDAKAALRWIVANANTYGINTDYITVGGGSAGAITAITLGISNPEDFRDELEISQDPTLATTNLDQTYQIQTIVDFWGSNVALDAHQGAFDSQHYDSNDPPLFIAHGTADPTVSYSNAEELNAIYATNGVPLVLYRLDGLGHGPWNATVDGKRLEELAFEFIVEQQNLVVE